MKRLFVIFFLSFSILNFKFSIFAQQIDGYPLANFGLTVNAGADGSMFGNVLQNTGILGEWLLEKGAVRFFIGNKCKKYTYSSTFEEKHIDRRFPFVRGSYANSTLIRSEMKTLAFCPLAINDAKISSLPVIMLETSFTNPSKTDDEFNIVIECDSFNANGNFSVANGTLSDKKLQFMNMGLFYAENFAFRCNSPLSFENNSIIIPLKVPKKGKQTLRVALSFYDSEWISAKRFSSAKDIVNEIFSNMGEKWDSLLVKTQEFERKIPQSGDAELDEYLRWYMISAVSLTRITKNDEVLTMGYAELNQRDSYWTSWLHLVLFPDLERKMIEESIEYQQKSGKIPTTILPLIEREDDLDINAFFILRAWRYYDFHKDKKALTQWFPALQKAMDWLISRDFSDNGLPEQVSFWGDWKDVAGVANRRYSPFSGLIYLSALKQMIAICNILGETDALQKYESAYRKGFDFINKSTDKGGLWNGNFYCQIDKNGSVDRHLLQDQMIGVFFGVVPPNRAEKIVESLNKQSLTQWGIAETTPYHPVEWGYAPGTYHNGGVWPWLSFMDCWARLKMGRKDEAVKLLKTVARADLVDSGDWSPNEDINSLTGENIGYQIQGWNAGLFGLIYFGLQETPK